MLQATQLFAEVRATQQYLRTLPISGRLIAPRIFYSNRNHRALKSIQSMEIYFLNSCIAKPSAFRKEVCIAMLKEKFWAV